jgi:Zn finger protein HypA/HybF involved in hydrogenase expression
MSRQGYFDVAPLRPWRLFPIFSIDRAQDVAAAILDTCDGLDQHATEEEMNEAEFRRELDSRVLRCESCGWWHATTELNAEMLCEACRGEPG